MTEVRLLIAILVMVSIVFVSQIVGFVVRGAISNEGEWCRSAGGVYVHLENGKYDCVGENKPMERIR